MGLRVAVVDPGNFAPFYCNPLCASLAGRLEYVALVTSPYPWEDYPFAGNYDLIYHFYRRGSRFGASPLRSAAKAVEHAGDWARLLRWIRSQHISLVHLQWLLLPLVDYWALRALRRMSVPVIFTAHDLLPKLGYPGAARLYRALYRRLDRLIVYADANAAELASQFRVDRARVAAIPPGLLFDREAIGLSRASARQQLGLEPDALILLLFGGVQRYKGLEVLLEAFARIHAALPQARLVIAGRARYPLPTAARQHGGVIADLRYLPEAEALAYFLSADLVVLPYRAAATSAVLLTALALGRPVVTSDVGALGDTVRASGAGLVVPPSDADALFGALHGLLSDRPRLQALEARAQQWRDSAPTWDDIAGRTVQLYQAALAGA
jgi:glycosyltransferase involved in cell wall biosynthesis